MNKQTQATLAAVLLIIVLAVLGFLGVDTDALLALLTEPAPEQASPSLSFVDTSPNVASGDWYDIYFTNPTCPPEEERTGGIDEIIAEDMLTAQNQVDIAGFDFDSLPMIEAMITLEKRGVIVRFVTDDEHNPPEVTNRLRGNGISVREDQRSALMHNKFVIIDGRFLWVGSMNFTSNGVHCNNNNIVRFDAPALAANYMTEMDEMYIDREFGPRSPQNTTPQLNINGIRIENYFAAEDEIGPILGDLITQAQDEILFLAFSFTLDEVGEPMLDRARAGVTVRGVFETTGSETQYSYYPPLLDEGLDNIQVRQDGNRRIMHHKVIVIDRQITVLGSYNFSGSANDRNDENVLIVDDPEFTSYFVEEWEAVWAEAKTE